MCGDSARGRRPDERRRSQPRPPVVGPGVPLTDAQWARINPLLPDRTPKRGGRWRDHREVIDAIAFKFQTGTQCEAPRFEWRLDFVKGSSHGTTFPLPA
ncbi:transposase [Streptomyces sp. NBC_01483]|uniref:transposase n=1 Tax=Streptomyces sp. NBC_01483 TaxID=2903883 RepID=UPI003FCD3D6F